MTVRSFLMWPDRRLKAPVAAVAKVDATVHAIWTDMIDTMYAMPGVGLAAPQIGIMQALAVLDCSDQRNAPIRLANPTVLAAADKLAEEREGSPNVPDQWATVRRPAWVRVGYLDEQGAPTERKFEGLWAVSVQHQIDHLAGRMFFDRLGPTKRRMLIAKHLKALRRKDMS